MPRLLLALTLISWAGCTPRDFHATLVLTEVPARSGAPASNWVEQRYTSGSRIVLAENNGSSWSLHVISKRLCAAGEPVVTPDGQTIYFSGKRRPGDQWQIFRVNRAGGGLRQVTTQPGGAMSPTLIAGGKLVFCAPVPKEQGRPGTAVVALYSQGRGQGAMRLTFGVSNSMHPTALSDGRVLFVSSETTTNQDPTETLLTINNDGSEVTRFAVDHDGAVFIARPRELPSGQVVFLATSNANETLRGLPETVQKERPFASRGRLFGLDDQVCSSVEAGPSNTLLVCLQKTNGGAVYQLKAGTTALGIPLFQHSGWDVVEAVSLVAHPKPMGHLSTLDPGGKSGLILCLNAAFTRAALGTPKGDVKPERVRITTWASAARLIVLGEIELQPDGSFMAEVPADRPIGFETLAVDGRVLQRLVPSIWVRPGENRSCIGCHEPPNRAPRNIRPLAVLFPPAVLTNEFRSKASETKALTAPTTLMGAEGDDPCRAAPGWVQR